MIECKKQPRHRSRVVSKNRNKPLQTTSLIVCTLNFFLQLYSTDFDHFILPTCEFISWRSLLLRFHWNFYYYSLCCFSKSSSSSSDSCLMRYLGRRGGKNRIFLCELCCYFPWSHFHQPQNWGNHFKKITFNNIDINLYFFSSSLQRRYSVTIFHFDVCTYVSHPWSEKATNKTTKDNYGLVNPLLLPKPVDHARYLRNNNNNNN